MKNKFDIDRLAKLSKIELTLEEKSKFLPELEQFLEFAKCMDKYDLSAEAGLPEPSHSLPLNNDTCIMQRNHLSALNGETHLAENYFKLPRVVQK